MLLPFSAHAQTVTDPAKEAQRLTRVAQVAQQEGRYDDAIKAYETITIVAAREPRIAAVAHLNAGNVYMARGNYEAAAGAFERSIKLNANSAEAQNNLGVSLAYDGLAVSLSKSGRAREAIPLSARICSIRRCSCSVFRMRLRWTE